MSLDKRVPCDLNFNTSLNAKAKLKQKPLCESILLKECMNDTILQVDDLIVSFRKKETYHDVVSHINFTLERGKILGLVGESGSGKSISALAIMQLLPFGAYVGKNSKIIFQRQSLLDCSERQMRAVRGHQIGMIFQDAMSAFNPVLTIAQQMNEVLWKFKPKERRERALKLLDEVGIKDVYRTYHSYPHQLSGGMRQRAMIAQALCGEPALVIADEPTTALDLTIQAQVLNLLLKLRETRKLSILFITHDLSVVSHVADDILVMKKGTLVETNTTHAFFSNPQKEYSRKLLRAILPTRVENTPDPHRETLLAVDNLKVYFLEGKNWFKKKYFKAVDGVSLKIPKGETLALVGESGSGKTTVAKAVIQLLKNISGHIIFEGQNLSKLSNKKLKLLRNDIQIIFQDPYAALNPRAVIAQSILEGVRAQYLVKGRAKQIQLVDELLKRVGLKEEHKWRYPHEFSGGERQRICIARALALRPKLLILDEPTSALDVSIQMQILNLLKELQTQYNISFLLITHNVSVVSYLAHSLAVMYHGRIVETGDTHSVLNNPQHKYTQTLLSAVLKTHEAKSET